MRTVFYKLYVLASLFFVFSFEAFGQSKPLYQLPETIPEKKSTVKAQPFLVGTDNGLFKVATNGNVEALWTKGKVDRILKTSSKWYFVTDKGIVVSEDLRNFSEKNNGLPFLTIKTYDGKNKKLELKSALLKDICADPLDPKILVTATKDSVYLTRDGGETWKSIGSTSRTAGIKAVAVSHMPVYEKDGTISGTELVAFLSHPIYGLSYYKCDASKPVWIDVSGGFSAMPSLTQVDEISDILPVLCKGADGTLYSEIYCAQTFIPNIYRFNWNTKRGEKIFHDSENCETIDSLCQSGSKIIFASVGKIRALSLETNKVETVSQAGEWKTMFNAPHAIVNSAYVPRESSGVDTSVTLSELWLLNPSVILSPWGETANGKKSVYVSAYQMRTMEGINKYKKIIANNKLNSLVVDMKDDYGLLRFEPKSPLLKKKGYVTQYKVDLDKFVEEYKKTNTYLIGRIVVFKDRHLSTYDKQQYAVWDAKNNKPWMGIRGKEAVKDENGNVTGSKTAYYDENWVDPYSEEVWEYNVEIAKELISRGFDEVQFDYIRFPTDGTNLSDATYRWKDKGMDMESALVSFLSYARKNINAPIGIDIYGANGWYRSGTRTGQDVELMSEYVDVICPMFYPSHFEQNFLEYAPYEERPYRIYFYGSYRNTVIGRNRIVVRPWIQAFYMGVRYDRTYYNKDYVQREVFGTRDGLDRGYMHWNNSGRWYEDISPDPGPNEKSPWHKNEADLQKRIPAFGPLSKSESDLTSEFITQQKLKNKEMLSVWNTVINQEWEQNSQEYSERLLQVNHP